MRRRPSPRGFDHGQFSVEDLIRREESICVMLPARNEAASIGAILDVLMALRRAGAIDEVVVVDTASSDGTAQIASERRARVLQGATLLPEFGGVLGKGDAVWRGLSAIHSDIVCVLDADLADFDRRFVLGLVGPLLAQPSLRLVKGAFERPHRDSQGRDTPGEGGRVTELMARPLLRLWYPELAAFDQPLSGQWAGRQDLIVQLAFWTGYALEICLLLEAYERAGMSALAQSDLGTLHNRHQPLKELGAMADQVLVGFMQHVRLRNDGALLEQPERFAAAQIVRRPPLTELDASAVADDAAPKPGRGLA